MSTPIAQNLHLVEGEPVRIKIRGASEFDATIFRAYGSMVVGMELPVSGDEIDCFDEDVSSIDFHNTSKLSLTIAINP